ncbi:MAG: T9SS type A sorting domain-containing protein [Lewinellaceae bacterium]|nr:T9SS type A sorting domain-containing protein [Lewinellaceae bacterium]
MYQVDDCEGAVDLALYFGQAPGIPQTTGLYDNTAATAAPTDPAVTCWNEDVNNTPNDVVNNSLWYTFIGDGNTYHIETVPCNASNYIDDGDTQMLIFTGDHCADLSPIICNDDLHLNGDPDYRAGLDLETTNGQNYYMLIDGFAVDTLIATGEFCIQITLLPTITCASAAVGAYSVFNNGVVCFGQNLNQIIEIDPGSFVIPNFGPVYGMVWSITTAPIPANTWPGVIPDVASSLVSPIINVVSAVNNGSGLQPGQYYLTASVVAGGVLINPAATERSTNVDPGGGCFVNGPSLPISFVPNLAALSAMPTISHPSSGNDGSINLTVTGGLADPPGNPSALSYTWSGPNGFTASTQHITGLAAGSYLVTITDPSGCVAPFTASYTLETSGLNDPFLVKTLDISPNPTSGALLLNLELIAAADVRIEILNTLGQVVQTINTGKHQQFNHSFDLSGQPNGTYLLRLTIGQDIALRRIVLHR